MNALAISGFFVGFTCLFLAVFILRYGTNNVQRSFGLQNFAISLWGFGNGLAGLAKNATIASFWWKVALTGGFCIIPLLVNHTALLNNLSRRKLLIALWVWAIAYPLLCVLRIDGMRMGYVFNSFYLPQPANILYVTYYAIWIIVALYVSLLVIKGYLKVALDEKRAMLLYAIAYLGGMWGGGTYIFMVALNLNLFYPYGNFLISVYCVIVAYAVFRHKLLDIEVIIRKTLVFAGLLVSVFLILIFPTVFIQEYIFRSSGRMGRITGLTISGVIIILTMRKIESFLKNVTDKYLFQKKYDYKELLKTFTTEVLTVLEMDNLVNLTVDKLTGTIKLDSCAVLLFNEEEQQFDVAASRGLRDPAVTLPDDIVTFMKATHSHIMIKELRQKKIFVPPAIQETIDKLNAELMIPLVMNNEMKGVLSLGKKKSDEDYTQDDLDILLPLAKTFAIAIANAKLFVELGQTQAKAAQAEKMAVIGTLSAGINHEICNPLGIARGQCEAFLLNIKDGLYKTKTTEELLTKAKEIMAKVIKETDRATSITKKLSTFAKPSKGDLEIINVAQEIDDVIGLVGYELKLEKIEFERRLQENLPNIFVDKKQIEEILFNLIRNAGQAIGEKGKIAVSAYTQKKNVVIEIKDTGSGIPPDKIKQLFNPFFTTKDPGKGTGLGLFIVRQVVEKNEGRIYLKETKVNEGTTFALEFPIATPEMVETARREALKKKDTGEARKAESAKK